MELLTDDGQALRLEQPIGYVILEHEQDGLTVEVGTGMWQELHISVRGDWSGGITKGGIALNGVGRALRESDMFKPGLHTSVNDEEGDRRY